tara:strand:- start:1696 stop:2124 length:429 start_codon:yes stop_codon:yes gene_type:complete
MNCAVDTTKIQQDDGTMRGVEIIPEGCQPVSESECSSGYMAPSNNVTFPGNSLKQCCKCKIGQDCPLCANPSACTEDEKEEFVTDDNCFGQAMGPSTGLSTGPSTGPSSDTTDLNTLYIASAVGVLLLIVTFVLITRRSKTI